MSLNINVCLMLVMALTIQIVCSDQVRGKKPKKKCSKPKGTAGDVFEKDCLKYTCQGGEWVVTLSESVCCYEGTPYLPGIDGTVITTTTADDGCTEAYLLCQLKKGKAEISLKVNTSCPKPATQEMVDDKIDELKQMLENHMEQSDQLSCCCSNDTVPEGIIISSLTSVEVFIPGSQQSCTLPPLPNSRLEHSMDNLWNIPVICGGEYPNATCVQFLSRQWTSMYTTLEARTAHSSWVSSQGLVLMGGRVSAKNTETIPLGGIHTGGMAFSLEHVTDTSCAITDDTSDSTIITGGLGPSSQVVSRYNLQGHVEELPEMNIGRWAHGCAAFKKTDGTLVLMVAGGWNPTTQPLTNSDQLSSSEMLSVGSTIWTMAAPLPWTVNGLSGVTLGNRVFMIGGWAANAGKRSDVMAYEENENKWEKVGQMQQPRVWHAATTIKMQPNIMDFCT